MKLCGNKPKICENKPEKYIVIAAFLGGRVQL